MRSERTLTVWEVLYDLPYPGPDGPAGDGTMIQRFTHEADARRFAADHTCYGRSAGASRADVPKRIADRWSIASSYAR